MYYYFGLNGTVFCLWVSFVSFSVVLFSESYMIKDLHKSFFVMMFVLSLFLLILSFNLMGILLGCYGLGLISYCLVVYFQNNRSFRAMLTALINRLGDASLITSICWMLNYGCWHYLFYSNSCFMDYSLFLLCLLILQGKPKFLFLLGFLLLWRRLLLFLP